MKLSNSSSTWAELESTPYLVLALQMISSACTLCLSIAGLWSFQMSLPAFLVRWGWELEQWVGVIIQLPCLSGDRPGSRAKNLWGLKSDRLGPHWIPRLDHANDLVLQVSRVAGWDYFLGSAGKNWVCQDQSTSCCKPLSPCQDEVPFWFLCNLHGVRPEWELPRKNSQCWGSWMSAWARDSLEAPEAQGRFLSM